MTTKTKTTSRPAVKRSAPRAAKSKTPMQAPVTRPVAETPPWTTEERLHRIAVMAQRINEYVRFMCQAGSLQGSSGEATERAVTTFYEQMLILERQLGHIHDEFKLE